jgi:hypothetical protein
LLQTTRARYSRGQHWRWSWGFVTIIVLFEDSEPWFLEVLGFQDGGTPAFSSTNCPVRVDHVLIDVPIHEI